MNTDKGKIKYIKKVETGCYIKGTHFSKGDYIPTETSYIVHVNEEDSFEVKREVILSFFPGRKKITEKLLDSFIGKDANILR